MKNSSSKDKDIKRILEKWVEINERISNEWQIKNSEGVEENDCPWWYGERACVSILAGAIWQEDGYVLEEYIMKKDCEGEDNPGRHGRCDLFFEIGNCDYRCEAKVYWTGDTLEAKKIDNYFDNGNKFGAEVDVKKIKISESYADLLRSNDATLKYFAVVFLVPSVSNERLDKNWIKTYKNTIEEYSKDTMHYAYYFRSDAPIGNNNKRFPGIAILLKEVAM
ncbi:hypothetical protein KJ975_00135 [Myxococcota bacterium]|nr:hypothetical protein [Myxococcota bacterium]